jgi:hypothetical protein
LNVSLRSAIALALVAVLLNACALRDARDSGYPDDLTFAPGLPVPGLMSECRAPCTAMPGRGCC